MKMPSTADRFVKVAAYLTDEVFGYEHWRAAQFCAPDATGRRPAVLILCRDEAEQQEALAFLKDRAERVERREPISATPVGWVPASADVEE